jgi:hypothetical protein
MQQIVKLLVCGGWFGLVHFAGAARNSADVRHSLTESIEHALRDRLRQRTGGLQVPVLPVFCPSQRFLGATEENESKC